MPAETEIGFRPDEMSACEKCGRVNPPNRAACLYCGASIAAVDPSQIRLTPRVLENWEKGFNVIVISTPNDLDVSAAMRTSRNTSIEVDLLRDISAAGAIVPIARVENETEAAIVQANLKNIGFETRFLSDAELSAEKLPVRCRAIRFAKDEIILTPLNRGPETALRKSEICLFVTGAIIELKLETTEKRKRRSTTVTGESTTSFDMPLLDIYSKTGGAGYRIPGTGFDFSALGADKSIVAAHNLETLTRKLRDFAPDAKFVDDYLRLRQLLDAVWEPDSRKETVGVQRLGFGRKESVAVLTSSNGLQFTKYSRMQRHLL